MATIAIQAGELSGTSGLTLWVYLESTGVLQNTGGDSLSESPASTGRFVASVAETLTGVMYCLVKDSGGYVVRDGYLDDGDTIIQPGYPSSGGGGGGGTVITLPGSVNQQARVRGSKIEVFIGEAVEISRSIYDSNGTAVDLSALTGLYFAVCLDDDDLTELASSSSITISGAEDNTFAVTTTATMVAAIRGDLIWALRDVNDVVYAHGPFIVAKAARA